MDSSRRRHGRDRATRVLAVVLATGGLAFGVGVGTALGSTKDVVISTMKTSSYGTILVAGHTVYTLSPSHTPCHATCLVYWPEVLLPKGATKAVAGPGVNAAKLGTHRLASGRLQVTYAGRALYFFALDKAAGQVKGNVTDTWGIWRVVVTKKAVASSTTTTSSAKTTTTTAAGGGGGGIGF